jgi:hypothetical protein
MRSQEHSLQQQQQPQFHIHTFPAQPKQPQQPAPAGRTEPVDRKPYVPTLQKFNYPYTQEIFFYPYQPQTQQPPQQQHFHMVPTPPSPPRHLPLSQQGQQLSQSQQPTYPTDGPTPQAQPPKAQYQQRLQFHQSYPYHFNKQDLQARKEGGASSSAKATPNNAKAKF